MIYNIQTEAQKKRTPTSTYEFGAHLHHSRLCPWVYFLSPRRYHLPMRAQYRQFLLAIIVDLALCLGFVWFNDSHYVPKLNATAVPKSATLNQADIEKLLDVERFCLVRRVRQVPIVGKESFSNFTGLLFALWSNREKE